jgi:hypothetical protein
VKVIHALGAYRSPIQAAERQSISTGVIVSPSIQFLDWVLFSVLGLPKGWQPYTLLKNIRLRPEIVILKLIHALQREPEQWVKARKFLEDYQQFRESPIIKTARSPLNDLAAYVADLLIPSVQEAERLITRQLGGAGSPRVIDVQVTLAARAA